MDNKTLVEVDGNGIFVKFDWNDRTPGDGNLGRAEFTVCIKYSRTGAVNEFWVDPIQTHLKEYWHMSVCNGMRDFTLASYGDIADPRAWLFMYCMEHKTQSFRVYAPGGAQYIEINSSGLSFWAHQPKE